jgi:hypothetical protein
LGLTAEKQFIMAATKRETPTLDVLCPLEEK